MPLNSQVEDILVAKAWHSQFSHGFLPRKGKTDKRSSIEGRSYLV